MLNQFANLLNKRSKTKSQRNSRRQLNLELENLEKRELFIVGAFGLPAIADVGTGFDGVVRVSTPNGFCTGTLLNSGRHVLTAAHCVDRDVDTDRDGTPDRGNGVPDAGNYTVRFDMPWGVESFTAGAGNVSVPTGNFNGMGSWNGDEDDGRDIAVIELNQIAPQGAERYFAYSGRDEEDRWGYIVGYGRFGQGNQKVDIDMDGDGIRDRRGCDASAPDGRKRIGTNYFDDTDGPRDSELELDFDSNSNNWAPGSTPNNSNNRLNEVGAAGGDSGGPGFLWGPSGLEIASVSSRGTSDRCTDAWYDPGMTFTRVSSWSGWINQQMTGRDDIVLDLSKQPAGSNGSNDFVSVSDSNGVLAVSINGLPLHNETLANVNSFTVIGSNESESVTITLGGSGLDFDIDGRGGIDSLTINSGSANDSIYVYSDRISSRGTRIDYNLESIYINAGSGNDYIGVYSTHSSTPVSVNGNLGNDRIYVGSNLSNIRSNVSVFGGSHTDRLIVRDYYSSGDSYTIQNNSITTQRKGNWELTPNGLENIVLETGSGNDTINSTANQYSTTVTIRSGYGDDTIYGGSGREILIGGYGDDTIHAGGGRDFVIGGIGADNINGGAGEDILFDGVTSSDYNDTALMSLMNEWKRTDRSYTQRISNLENGGGLNGNYRFNSNTVNSDYYSDTLTGGADRDWFWAQNRWIFTFPGQPPAQPRDTLTDWVAFSFPGRPDNSESVN